MGVARRHVRGVVANAPRADRSVFVGPGALPEEKAEVRKLKTLAATDAAIALLAMLSFGIAVAVAFDARVGARPATLMVDLIVSSVFAVEFAWRTWRSKARGRYVASRGVTIVALVPLVLVQWVAGLDVFGRFERVPLEAILLIVVALARLVRAYDAVRGDRAAENLVDHFRKSLVQEASDRATLRVLDQLEENLVAAPYGLAIARALETHHEDVRSAVRGMIEDVPGLNRAAHTRAGEAAIARLTDRLTDHLADVVRRAEVEAIVAAAVRGAIDAVREQVGSAQQRGETSWT